MLSPSFCNTKFSITLMFVLVIVGTALFTNNEVFGREPDDSYLKKVFIIFRHGNRNPTETYPHDPHINYSWPGGWGALNKKGMRQMYDLGDWLQEKYGGLTDNKYVASKTMVNSSFSDRCLESTQAFLAGFFKQNEEEAFVPGLPWRPIPVHYVPGYMDKILSEKNVCPKAQANLQEAYRNESRNYGARLKPYYNDLSRITGQEVRTVSDVEDIYDTLEIEVKNGLELPEELKPYYNEKMRELATRSITILTTNDVGLRLRGGPLLKDVLDNMYNNKRKEKLFFYATHDRNLVNSLRAMGFTNEHWEFYKLGFGATLIFELRGVDGDESQEVRISMLKNGDSRSLIDLKIPGCEGSCKLDNLAVMWKKYLPLDWENECES